MKTSVRKLEPRARRPRKPVEFLQKPTCSTCRKARRFLEKRGVRLNVRDLTKNRLTPAELQKLIGNHDHQDFLNPRSGIYRKKNEGPSSFSARSRGHDGHEPGPDSAPGYRCWRSSGHRL
ncbi:MAG: hypothetical protein LAO19_10260 [Acidobacteriia bacterium]|nr:hypothetical protein [Terriglobia bacterium]